MPRDPFLPLTRPEQRFVLHYLREGAVPEIVHIAERKARLKVGEGKGILRRRHVQEEIHRRKVLIEFEENRLIARDSIGMAAAADERDRVTLNKIEAALDKVIQLDAEKHASSVLEAVRLGLVYTGTIRDGRRERVTPADPTKQENSAGELGFYSSIFSDLRGSSDHVGAAAGAAAPADPAPLMPEDEKPVAPPTLAAPPAQTQRRPKVAETPNPRKKRLPEIEIT